MSSSSASLAPPDSAASWQKWALLGLLAAAVACHLVSLFSLPYGFLDSWFNDSSRRIGRGADFFAVYQAGTNFLNNDLVYAAQGIEREVPYFYPFRYVPSMAYTVGLVSNVLPARDAYWAWVAFNELLLAINICLTWRFTTTQNVRFVAAAMWLLFSPLYLELYMGQFSFLMGTLFFWMGIGFLRDSPLAAGVSWALSLVVKSNSLLFVPIWLRMRAWNVIAAGIGFAVLLNAPYFLLKDGSFDAWRGNFAGITGGSTTDFHAGAMGLRNLLSAVVFVEADRGGVMLAVLARLADAPLWVPIFVGLSLIATFCTRKLDAIVVLSMWIAAYFLIYKQVWEHQYVMLLPALVLLVMVRPQLRGWAIAAFVLVALPTPYWLLEQISADPNEVRNPAFSDPQHAWASGQIIGYHLSKVLPVLALWLVLVVHALHEPAWPWQREREPARSPAIDPSPSLG